MPVAVVTGASRGLGRALAEALAADGWSLVVDARTSADLATVAVRLRDLGARTVVAVPGSVAEQEHRLLLAEAVAQLGRLDLLVNNASMLGPSPQPRLADYPLDVLEQVYAVNVLAPLGLVQALLEPLRVANGALVNITSDASTEPYDGWGGYGSSKAALDQLTAILAVSDPTMRVYAFDPGDMRTRMHQEAFPARTSLTVPSRTPSYRGCWSLSVRSCRAAGIAHPTLRPTPGCPRSWHDAVRRRSGRPDADALPRAGGRGRVNAAGAARARTRRRAPARRDPGRSSTPSSGTCRTS